MIFGSSDWRISMIQIKYIVLMIALGIGCSISNLGPYGEITGELIPYIEKTG